MDQIHVGDLTVAKILSLRDTEHLEVIYHRQGQVIGYVLPNTSRTRDLLGITNEGEAPCLQDLTSDTEQ